MKMKTLNVWVIPKAVLSRKFIAFKYIYIY